MTEINNDNNGVPKEQLVGDIQRMAVLAKDLCDGIRERLKEILKPESTDAKRTLGQIIEFSEKVQEFEKHQAWLKVKSSHSNLKTIDELYLELGRTLDRAGESQDIQTMLNFLRPIKSDFQKVRNEFKPWRYWLPGL